MEFTAEQQARFESRFENLWARIGFFRGVLALLKEYPAIVQHSPHLVKWVYDLPPLYRALFLSVSRCFRQFGRFFRHWERRSFCV
jgi:hypothetical protein